MAEELQIVMKAKDILKKEDFENAFKKILELILRREEQMSKAIDRLEEAFGRLTAQNREDYVSGLTDIKNQTNQLFVGDQLKRMDSETKTNFKNLRTFLDSVVDRKLKDVDLRMSKVDESDKTSKKNLEGLGKAVSANLELKMKEMDGHKSLKDETVEELKKEMEKIKGILANIPRGKAMGRAKSQVTRRVDLTSQVDGNTRSFTLPPDTIAVLGIQGSQFPFTMADVDISLTGNVMTLGDQVATPQAGQTLVALLDVLFYP